MRARVMPLALALALVGLPGCSVDAASLASLFTPPQSARNQAPVASAAGQAPPLPPLPAGMDPAKTTVVIKKPDGTTVVTGPNAAARPTTGAATPPAAVAGPILPPGAAPLTEGTPILTPSGQVGPAGQLLLASLAEVEAELSAALEVLLAKAEVAGALDPRPELVEGLPPVAEAAPAARRLSQAEGGFGLGIGAGGITVDGPDGTRVSATPGGVSVGGPNGGMAAAVGSFVAPLRPGRAGDVLRALAKRATLALDRGEDGQLVPRLNVAVGADELPDGRARSLSLKLDRSRGAKLVVAYEVAAKGDRPAVSLLREVSVVQGALQHAVSGKLGDEAVSYLRTRGGGGEGQISGALAMAFRFALAGPQPTAPAAGGGAVAQPGPVVQAPAASPSPDLLGDRPPFDPLPAGSP